MPSAPRVVVVSGPSPDVRLTVWPVRYEPWPTWLILCGAAAFSAAGGRIAGSWLFGLAALAALAVALWRLWIPVEIRLYELGVTQTVWRRSWRTPWRGLSGYRVCRRGVLLMPEDDHSALHTLQGLYVP
ncbi:MAG: hypothetical protein KDA41_19280, partial [Planctomycetales bacterium]|nr:hypothetical protein [Planctomycetales bacterium]